MIKRILLATLASSLFAVAGGDMDETITEVPEAQSSQWEHELTIYGWLPTLGGTLNYTIPGDPTDPTDPDTEGESSVLDNIDAVFMGSYEIRKDKWSFLIDGIYYKMSDAQAVTVNLLLNRTLTAGSQQEFTSWIVSGYAGYNLIDNDQGRLDMIAGVRYFSLELDVDLFLNNRQKSFSPSTDFTDALVGIKGYYNINQNWYVPYLFDIGTGDTDLTYQAEASLGYRFDWGNILLTYRYIHYESDDTFLVNELDMYGPKIGVVFNF
ncbi:MAG: hypothetical protein GQ531_07615 [Sulfurovum sp.]|nr:hypothetical protein [Sulfurovum sp.]